MRNTDHIRGTLTDIPTGTDAHFLLYTLCADSACNLVTPCHIIPALTNVEHMFYSHDNAPIRVLRCSPVHSAQRPAHTHVDDRTGRRWGWKPGWMP